MNTSSTERTVHTLVIARYKENISWVKHVPDSFDIIIYNKSKRLPLFQKLLCKLNDRIQVVHIPNCGREAETYLRYVKETAEYGDPESYTVFCQGNPFEHSPDFLQLLNRVHLWDPLQPLSYRWRKDRNIPPKEVLKMDKRHFIEGLRVRVETFSLYSLGTIYFLDKGIQYTTKWYQSERNLGEGVNISHHFLKECNLPEIAKTAACHNLGRFTFGAIFAVKNQLLNDLQEESIYSMYDLTHKDDKYGYLFERHWMHIFGEPFLLNEREIPSNKFQEVQL
ncbi:hypothetical protein [Rhodohalobacter sulfatireducens]|uniref:DUF3431 domain-containing protein n=1 Tax=Rhodohalobacter sulfatireducens TaxID=2911366 RepID=A0ABS9KHP0_9BACT|nr:hypothetical protein [Rhodohalobacter sulfatireducens]MCG2590346.1 hypothetical protein [Rhodohalobacter sulfatireducens]